MSDYRMKDDIDKNSNTSELSVESSCEVSDSYDMFLNNISIPVSIVSRKLDFNNLDDDDGNGETPRPPTFSPPYKRVRALKLFDSPHTPKSLLLKCSTPSHPSPRTRLHPPKFNVPTGMPSGSSHHLHPPCAALYTHSSDEDSGLGSLPPDELEHSRRASAPLANINPFTPDGPALKRALSKTPKSDRLVRETNISRYNVEFVELDVIGRGHFGIVTRCVNKLDGCVYALKRSLRPVAGSAAERAALNEVQAHAALGQHPHLVTYYSAWKENNHMIIQSEYCDGGSLQQKIEQGALPESELLFLLAHVASGLAYIHSRQLVHLDLKPGNIFICRDDVAAAADSEDSADDDDAPHSAHYNYKIGDLGHVTSTSTPSVEEGDCRYLPKEVLQEDYTHLTKADIFAFGLTLYEAGGGGALPMNGPEWHDIRDGKLPDLPALSRDFNQLLKKMVDPDPAMRPSAARIRRHPLLHPGGNKSKAQLRRELKVARMENEFLAKKLQEASKCIKSLTPRVPSSGVVQESSKYLTRSAKRLQAATRPTRGTRKSDADVNSSRYSATSSKKQKLQKIDRFLIQDGKMSTNCLNVRCENKMEVMWMKFIILFIPYSLSHTIREEIIFHYNNTYKYNEPYTVEVSKTSEFIMEFAGDHDGYNTPARVTVASDFANRTYPLFITARQQKGVFSWQLPMLVQTLDTLEQFTNISRTLCPHNNIFSEDEDTCDVSSLNTPIVHLTSSSPDPIKVTITVETVEDFYIKLNSVTNLTSTPSQPKYYFYPFDQGPNKMVDVNSQSIKKKYICNRDLDMEEQRTLERYFVKSKQRAESSWWSKPQSVILMIESDDDICAVVSIQNFSCPVFDNERDILYDGYYLTMTRRGGITLTQDTFPLGFYIVFIVKTSDDDCTGSVSSNTSLPKMVQYFGWDDSVSVGTNDGRVKRFSFKVIQTISYKEYAVAAGAALGFFLAFYVAFVLAVLCQRRADHRDTDSLSAPVLPHNNENVRVCTPRRRHVVNDTSSSSRDLVDDNHSGGSSSSDTESGASTEEADNDAYPHGGRLCVASLARCRPRVLQARSKMYLWNVLTVAVFYTLPVIQLVVTYQRLLNQSGNQDLCYFNFLCAHPLSALSDFNHVYSNLGYVLLGALFLAQVWRRHQQHRRKTPTQKELGIPQHFGLLYAMGIALVSEGLLSAAYHVCPNSMNFQFDTSFMYVTSVLCMVKIYQSRHPDINARAHATFGVLALIIFIGLVGVLNANFYFWVAFTALHLVTCLIMTFQIYYLGRFRLDGGVVYRAARALLRRPLAAVTPTHCGRCVLLVIANVANWALAGLGMSEHSRDFASHLLLVLMSNLFLYTLFYIVMKLLHRESIRWYSWIFIATTYTIWFGSSYFYLDLSTNWALTPAQSRQSNRMCSLLQLYDSHDVWHFLSATAMFFSFNMYLTIDDNLADTPRDHMMVF
ncbi:SID1 transmembrane family member 1 [Bicyclus anynana]|uniref:SID1 transmembrane family member 1 n=1 Tax=Bicyclus anynana TaxID=110368 RepID=A0ABM3LI88_BICAN|nr:SID1 transmembrane family member 1 [Bicyclus anynana]